MGDLIERHAAIDALMEILDRPNHAEFLYTDEICRALNHLPSAQPEKDMIHLQKEQAYMQGWEEGRNALREEIWESERDRLD